MNKKKLFYQSFLQLQSEAEVQNYLADLLSPAEIKEFTERLWVANLLNNKATYAEIVEKTSMSSTTIARVSKCLKRSRKGYITTLTKLHHANLLNTHL